MLLLWQYARAILTLLMHGMARDCEFRLQALRSSIDSD